MKRVLLLMLFISATSTAQKVAENKIDKFTDNRILQVNAMEGKNWQHSDVISKGMFKNIFLSFKAINNNLYLQLGVNTGGTLLCISESSKTILLFSDGSKLSLSHINDSDCSHNLITGVYPLSLNDLETFTNKELTDVRIYFSDGYTDYEIRKNKKNIISETARLFKENLLN